MNEVVAKEDIKIEDMIYEIRGKQVMLDSDLARLYKCKNGTKTINLAVKRHINRFPERFCFKLTEEEYKCVNLKFQVETSSLMALNHYLFLVPTWEQKLIISHNL